MPQPVDQDTPGSAPVTRRRRGTLNRKTILDAASELFRSKGYDRTKLDDVAAAVQVTKPVLYYHFASKEDILLACVQQACGDLDAGLAADDHPGLSGRERLEIFLHRYLIVITGNFGISLVLAKDEVMSESGRHEYLIRRKAISRHVYAIVQQGMDDGSLAPGNLMLTTYAIFSMFNWVARWKSQKPGLALDEIQAEFHRILFNGLGTGA